MGRNRRGPPATTPRAPRGRPRGQVATPDNILRAAIRLFARDGYAGARVQAISRAARSTDRMIYYYFGSKENLFVATLESVYRDLADAEARIDLAGLAPEEALKTIFRFTWDYYQEHPEMLALLDHENLQKGRHLARSRRVQSLSVPLIATLEAQLSRGVAAGLFRREVRARDLYIASCALGYFYLSNRYTLSAFLGVELMQSAELHAWHHAAEDLLLRYVRATP